MPVNDHNAPVVRRKTQHEAGRHLVVRGKNRSSEPASPTSSQLDRAIDVFVRHYGTNRTKRLHRMDCIGVTRITAVKSRRRHEGPTLSVRANDLELVRVT